MKVLIKNARIVCSGNAFHKKISDIFVIDGIIDRISPGITEEADQTISIDNLHVSLGWLDIFSHFNDPGSEYREDLGSGSFAAWAGGFTDIMLVPNTQPAITSKSSVEYLVSKSESLPAKLWPIGGITKDIQGKELTEMYDMRESGAIAFSDGLQPVQEDALLLKALQYLIPMDATLIQMPHNRRLAAGGLMHEGHMSTKLGLPGKPAMAEELMIMRDIELLRYTGSKLHITGLSTRRGLDAIRQARKEGLRISCSVTPYHCFFCDEDLADYDTRLKTDPPLRSREDMEAIRKGLTEGAIDCIAVHHRPLHTDEKDCDFESALPGMEGLESAFGALNRWFSDSSALIEMLTVTNRRIFGIPVPEIAPGAPARLTLFDPDKKYIFEKSMIRSRSANNAFVGKSLTGMPLGTIIGGSTNLIAS